MGLLVRFDGNFLKRKGASQDIREDATQNLKRRRESLLSLVTCAPEQEVGVLQWILGKSVSSVVLIWNTGQNDRFVGIAAPYLARILPMFGGEILCQPDAFLCSVNDVKVVNSVDQRARNIVVAGSEGFLRQRLSRQGLAFILAGGSELRGFRSEILSGLKAVQAKKFKKLQKKHKYDDVKPKSP
ncbi:Mitochondrial biogenesis protein AIM24 protein [Raphanus sativus]|nr:Mitochondrial biogenesis protein AIM24 protein [Raphanus sativus]